MAAKERRDQRGVRCASDEEGFPVRLGPAEGQAEPVGGRERLPGKAHAGLRQQVALLLRVAATAGGHDVLPDVLASAGASWTDVVKSTVYLTDMRDFPRMNEVYARAMGDARPARSTVQVSGLPRGVLVEIDLIAALPTSS